MKSLCIILTSIVLLLAFKPCCNDKDCTSTGITIKTADTHSASKKECGGCSPFFSCGTCAGCIIAKTAVHKSLSDTGMPLKHLHFYRAPYLEDVTRSIWQPPQLG